MDPLADASLDSGQNTGGGGNDGGTQDGGATDGALADGGDANVPCVDNDGDGYGTGCSAGPDCDDTDMDKGGPEVCDTIDNDCDGMTDEGFSICPMCTPDCEVSNVPGAGGWNPDASNSDGVVEDNGAISLGQSVQQAFYAWVSNTDEGTVSKLDARTNREVARYPSIHGPVTGAYTWNTTCVQGSAGNCPSRTAVDQRFDAYVANRAFNGQGSVTKFASNESDCVDRNSNGTIETSQDLNGDGSIDMTDSNMDGDVNALDSGEFIGEDDECILWTTPVGASNGVPRGLAVGVAALDSAVGDVWAGLFHEGKACPINADTGVLGTCIDLDIGGGKLLKPYGGAVDSQGRLWFSDKSGDGTHQKRLGYVDTGLGTFVAAADMPVGTGSSLGACAVGALQPYGIAVDGDDNVYLGGPVSCGFGLYQYTPGTQTWTGYAITNATVTNRGYPRGIAAGEDSLWMAISHETTTPSWGATSKYIFRFDLANLAAGPTQEPTMPSCREPVGVGVAFDDSVWAVCQNNNVAARLDPVTNLWEERVVGARPYTYSDFLGFGLNALANPSGSYRFVVEGCSGVDTEWQAIDVDATVPTNTTLGVYARTADTVMGLNSATWIGPFVGSPADLTSAPGPLGDETFMEVDLRLESQDGQSTPRVDSVAIAHECDEILL